MCSNRDAFLAYLPIPPSPVSFAVDGKTVEAYAVGTGLMAVRTIVDGQVCELRVPSRTTSQD